MHCILKWLSIIFGIHFVNGANILAFQGVIMRSHLHSTAGILHHLVPYHNITFYVPSELKYSHPNITTYNTVGIPARATLTQNQILKEPCLIDSYHTFYEYALHDNVTLYDEAFEDKDMQKLLKSDMKYDLLLVSGYNSEQYFPFAHKFNIPIIQISPSILLPWTSTTMGNPLFWDTDISFMTPEKSDSFYKRMKKYFKILLIWYRHSSVAVPAINNAVSKYFPPDTPDIHTLVQRTELVFLNTHRAMGFQQPRVPSIIEVGGMHVNPPKPLSKEIEDFIGDSGFIYFSLGSVIPESTINEETYEAMINVFEKLELKILWKWDGSPRKLSKNVMISKWFPQQDILGHKNIKLFITQGGMLSLIESSSFGVPVLIMPVLFDQLTNAEVVETIGYGLSLSFCEFTEQDFYRKVNDLLTNPKYSRKAKQISYLMQADLPKMREKINFWVDYVLKNKENSTLRDSYMTHIWLKNIPLDLFLGFSLIVLTWISVLIYVILEFCKSFKVKEKQH